MCRQLLGTVSGSLDDTMVGFVRDGERVELTTMSSSRNRDSRIELFEILIDDLLNFRLRLVTGFLRTFFAEHDGLENRLVNFALDRIQTRERREPNRLGEQLIVVVEPYQVAELAFHQIGWFFESALDCRHPAADTNVCVRVVRPRSQLLGCVPPHGVVKRGIALGLTIVRRGHHLSLGVLEQERLLVKLASDLVGKRRPSVDVTFAILEGLGRFQGPPD